MFFLKQKLHNLFKKKYGIIWGIIACVIGLPLIFWGVFNITQFLNQTPDLKNKNLSNSSVSDAE
jgi:amino acid permease